MKKIVGIISICLVLFLTSCVPKVYTVTFDTNGGTQRDPIEVEEGSLVDTPVDPLLSHYDFMGWYEDENFELAFDFSKEIESDITLYAKWVETDYNIEYRLPNEEVYHTSTYHYNDDITHPDSPITEDLVFDGWYLYDSEFTDTQMPGRNIVLYAKYETIQKTYDVIMITGQNDIVDDGMS